MRAMAVRGMMFGGAVGGDVDPDWCVQGVQRISNNRGEAI